MHVHRQAQIIWMPFSRNRLSHYNWCGSAVFSGPYFYASIVGFITMITRLFEFLCLTQSVRMCNYSLRLMLVIYKHFKYLNYLKLKYIINFIEQTKHFHYCEKLKPQKHLHCIKINVPKTLLWCLQRMVSWKSNRKSLEYIYHINFI